MADHYHLVGMAGVGMSALAQVLHDAGFRVSGSDRFADQGQPPEVLAQLVRSGVALVPQDGSGIGPDTRAVVVSTAIEPDNPDQAAATGAGVPIVHRAAVLASLAAGHRTVAVTGTCGKSTVTGMIGWLMEAAGMDPVVVNGAPVVNWMSGDRIGSVRWGRSDWWVLEADESDRSVLNFHPDWAVITNASKDHFSQAETEALFAQFRGQVRQDVISGLPGEGVLDGLNVSLEPGGGVFALDGDPYRLAVPGRHNLENAALAVALCRRVGCRVSVLQDALPAFRGIHRRLETVGTGGGVTVVDDYAHNPAKIRASWSALEPYYRRIHAVWRPHGFGPLRSMRHELEQTWRALVGQRHRLAVMPVFDAGGTADRTVKAESLVEPLSESGVSAAVVAPEQVEDWCLSEAGAGDVVLIMGARDPDLPRLARRILARLGS